MVSLGGVQNRVRYFESIEDASRSSAALIIKTARQAISARGHFSWALSGGSTPKYLYELISNSPLREQLDWSRILLFWGDERCVPPDHQHSNYNMTRQLMLDRLPLSEEQVFRMEGELPPADGAHNYEARLKKVLPGGPKTPPALDCILLGLGLDGHTASLFPGAAALTEKGHWVVNVPPSPTAEPLVPRLTFTLPLINRARQIIVLAGGPKKRAIIKQISSGEGGAYPAAKLCPEGDLFWQVY